MWNKEEFKKEWKYKLMIKMNLKLYSICWIMSTNLLKNYYVSLYSKETFSITLR
jgi:hypothetical protein